MLILTIVAVVFAYLFMAGVIHKNWRPWRLRECEWCGDNRPSRCETDHAAAAFFASALWPLALPVVLGTHGTAILGMSHGGKSRDERRREKEIAEATHKRNLAEIRRQETQALESALK